MRDSAARQGKGSNTRERQHQGKERGHSIEYASKSSKIDESFMSQSVGAGTTKHSLRNYSKYYDAKNDRSSLNQTQIMQTAADKQGLQNIRQVSRHSYKGKQKTGAVEPENQYKRDQRAAIKANSNRQDGYVNYDIEVGREYEPENKDKFYQTQKVEGQSVFAQLKLGDSDLKHKTHAKEQQASDHGSRSYLMQTNQTNEDSSQKYNPHQRSRSSENGPQGAKKKV